MTKYHYSPASRERLDECHEDLQKIFTEILRWQDCTVICGYRDMEEQNRAYVNGKSSVQWPDSKHNESPSLAIDAAPYLPQVGLDWSDTVAIAAFSGRVLQIAEEFFERGLISHKLRWGGDWDGDGRNKDQTFNDLVHFELMEVKDDTDG